MTKVTINEKEYDLNNIADEAKARVEAIQVCDRKAAQLRQELAILQTARNAYVAALEGMTEESK